MNFESFNVFDFLKDYISGFKGGFSGGNLSDSTVQTNITNLEFGNVIQNYFDTSDPNADILTLKLKDAKRTEFFNDQREIVKSMGSEVERQIFNTIVNSPSHSGPVLVRELGKVDKTKSAKEIYYPILLIAQTPNTQQSSTQQSSTQQSSTQQSSTQQSSTQQSSNQQTSSLANKIDISNISALLSLNQTDLQSYTINPSDPTMMQDIIVKLTSSVLRSALITKLNSFANVDFNTSIKRSAIITKINSIILP